MKKRIIFVLMAMCVALSGFALEVNECVYTPQGRFKIIDSPVMTSNFDADLTGWTGISATEGKTAKDIFVWIENGCAEGIHSVISTDATAGEGMYMTFEPNGQTYVVSFKMKGDVAVSVRSNSTEVSTNLVKVEGNSDGTFGGTTDAYVCSKGEELTDDWQTFNYAISGEATSLVYFISFSGMATNIEIADLQIAPAVQVVDLRQRDAMIEKMEAYRDIYDWSADVLDEVGYNDFISDLEAIGEEASQGELDEMLETANEILYGEGGFLSSNMDDYLAGNLYNYLNIGTMKQQKVSLFGDWNCLPAGRGYWLLNAYPELGHYQQGGKWCNGSPDAPMGVFLQKELTAGSYVFAIEGSAAVREPKKSSWTIDEGMKPAYGVAYVVKIVEGADPDTIVSVVKDLDPIAYTPFLVSAKITEGGTYEFGFMAYCKETHKNLTNGSVTYVRNASLYGKNGGVYNLMQLQYEADVREQIAAGRANLTTAAGYLADETKFWGKAELQDCVNVVEQKIANFELMDQDAIIATFDAGAYNKANRTMNAEEGLLVFEVYTAVKDILAANRRFVAVNDTLESLQAAIDAAEATLALRIYDAATGKGNLQDAIDDAKGLLTSMKKWGYSEENSFIVEAEIFALSDEVDAFKASIPAENIVTVVDIDFENDATLNAETQHYSIAGAAGVMEFSHFSTINPEGEDAPYQQGFWDNAEQKWKGYLRVGNGTGTVEFDPTVEGSMGTNILKVSCDFYIQGFTSKSVGFFLKDEIGSTLAALYRDYYNGTDTDNTFGVDMTKVWAKSGASYNDASPADAEYPTANVIQKTHFEVIMDYGTQTMYCTISSPNGSTTSNEVALTGIPTKFVLQCNYDNRYPTRRCWFDNLKIEKYLTGELVQPEKIWTIAGYSEVLGSSWDNEDVSNDMTYTSDGTFQLVKKNVELMAYYNYEFKVVANHSWEENYGQYGEIDGPNAYFSVDKDGIYDVTFCWNPNNGNLYATTKQISVSSNANMVYGVENQAFSKGQIQRLGIGMMNEDQITAFQFDIVLPQELSINGIFDTDGSYKMDLAYTNRARNTHIIDAEYQNDGSIRVIGYSSQNDAFRYNDGELLNIGVVVQDWASNGNYYVTLKNIRLINTEGEEFKAKDSWFVISVSGLKGDANNDGQVTMSDVVAIVNYVLGHPNANFNFYNADVNGNGEVTMADVVGVVNIVMGKTAAGARMAQPASLVPGTLTLDAKAGRMSVSLDNTSAYTAFQMDVTLPEGMSINDVAFTGRATSSHVLSMSTLENGKVRILGWSARNADLKGNSGELLTMYLSGIEMVGTVTVDNVLFVTADGMEYKLNAAEIYGETTGISQMENGQRTMDNSYDLQGRKVNSQLKKGLYIINNKKVVVK